MEVFPSSFLARTHTTPNLPSSGRGRTYSNASPPNPMTGHQANASTGHISTYSQPSSLRSSDSTHTSNSTLFGHVPPVPSMPATGTPVQADGNVLNKRADKEASLFQMCSSLLQRLKNVPGFQSYVDEEQKVDSNEDFDPVTLLWRVFRSGYPLVTIYDTWKPETPIRIDEAKVAEKQRAKVACFKFIGAVFNELQTSDDEKFIISDLFQDDTTGFVKVVKVVGRIVDLMIQEGKIQPPELTSQNAAGPPNAQRTRRQHIVAELVNTERTYVQHLEMLQDFRRLIDHKDIISGDAAHQIFLNLNALLDFQRRFLIRVEQVNEQPEENQNWAQPFQINKDAFLVYEPYIANQKACEKIVVQQFPRIQAQVRIHATSPEVLGMVESQTVLSSFLLKPFQRLAKYPLLLKELRDKADLDEGQKMDISDAIRISEVVLTKANDAIEREDRAEAVEELKERVDDWKGHRLENFGELLLNGTFQVIKGEASGSRDAEREYKIYLFDMILLCCKEMDPRKQKVAMRGRNALDQKGRPKLALKGRIFMQNVTDTIMSSKPGHYTCQIFWKGDPGIEYFTIRFTTEDLMRKWANQVEMKRRSYQENRGSTMSGRTTGSLTDFQAMNSLGPTPQNPHLGKDDDDDDDESHQMQGGNQEFPFGRSESDMSLRSRSTTNDSTMSRQYAQQRAGQQTPLTIQTRQLNPHHQPGSNSPQEWVSDSYFSPVSETPATASIRGSMQSGSFPFPAQSHPSGWVPDHSARFTAPAVPRQGSRDGMNGYQVNAQRGMQRPSLPPHSASAQATFTQSRMRSASSPDIQQNAPQRRTIEPSIQNGIPDLPAFPQNYAYNPAVLSRTQTASPAAGMTANMPMRTTPPSMAGRPAHPRSTPLAVHHEYPNNVHHAPSTSRDLQHQSGMRPTTPSAQGHHYSNSAGSAQLRASPSKYPPQVQHAFTSQAVPTLSSSSSAPSNLTAMDQGQAQYRIRVHCTPLGSSFVFVVPATITFETLRNRIDVKLQRASPSNGGQPLSLASGQLKLKYVDDDDYVTIGSDEDVQMAIETWREQQSEGAGSTEIELYCH